MNILNVRNFSIIAHIDHGKSTLADRLLERTGAIEKRKMKEQVLDSMDLERERGITIKMQPVRMEYYGHIMNLIDTPGHVDFSYEVSRALLCCEGALLLVDATQGIEAQTLSHYFLARKLGLTFIPVINKIDLPHARVDEVKLELEKLGGFRPEEIIAVSAKDGTGVEALLDAIIERIPAPRVSKGESRALVFDSFFESHKGIVAYVRVMDGVVKKNDSIFLKARSRECIAKEVGYMTPSLMQREEIVAGDVGYIVTGVKEPGEVRVGDTVILRKDKDTNIEALPGYQEPKPVVWASFFPTEQGAFAQLFDALSKLKLNDSSLSFQEKASMVLGRGFECGFLGTLHLEITAERLKREFHVEFVVTQPSVSYRITKGEEVSIVSSASLFPRRHERDLVEEQWMKLEVVAPRDNLQDVVRTVEAFEGIVGEIAVLGETRLLCNAEVPLRQMVNGFFDALKSATHGYASFSYEIGEWRVADLVRLDVSVHDERVEALSRVIRANDAEREARRIVERVKNVLPQELFQLKIQGEVEGRIVASETLKAMRKDVTGYLYGGDRSRKMKLWKKQQEGKKRLKEQGRVDIEPDVYIKLLGM
ncbi:MAG: translation elongation factor 4 [Patescibacteria group bacterium]